MQLTKTERVFKALSNAISPQIPQPITPSGLFEDSHLASKIIKRNQLYSTFSLIQTSSKKNEIRVRSLHEKTPLKQDISFSNASPPKFNMKDTRNLKIPAVVGRRSTTSEFRIKNLEILNKLKTLCTSYMVNPENLHSKIVKCLIKSMKTLNEMEFSYKEFFAQVPQVLRSIFFLEPHLQNRYKAVFSELENETIKNCVKLGQLSRIPYNSLCSILLNELEIKEIKNQENIKILNQKLKDQKEIVTQRDGVIEGLKKIIENKKNEELASPQSLKIMQLSKEVSTLEAENIEYKVFLDQLKTKKTKLEEDLYSASGKCEYYQDQIQKMEEIFHQYEFEKEKLLQTLQDKNDHVNDIKQQCQSFRHILDKIIIKVSKISDDHNKLEVERQKLIEDNKILELKAGVGFEGLTPRPNLQQIFEEKNLKMSSLIPKSKKKITTIAVIETLLTKVCEYQGKMFIMQSDNRKKPDTSMTASIRRPAAMEKNMKKSSVLYNGGFESANLKSVVEIGMFNSQDMKKETVQEITLPVIEEINLKKEIVQDIMQAKEILSNLT